MRINFYLLMFMLFGARAEVVENCEPKIAIIGGGIGGASASHFLGELFQNDVKIDLYEAGTIGGRLATVNIQGSEYEAGGSIIHSRNRYMQHFLDLLGLEHRPENDEIAGIWNGETFVFKESNWKILSFLKLVYRYGMQPIKLQRYINSILSDFEKIYDLQDSGYSFENVTALLSAMNTKFVDLLNIPGKSYFLSLEYEDEFIDEIMNSAMIVNYGQDVNIQSFVVCVSLAAVSGSLWSVKGGNKKVPESLIYRNSNINVVPAYVSKIVNLQTAKNRTMYEIHYVNEDSGNIQKSTYDIVIVAIPLTQDQQYPIQFENFPNNGFAFSGKYHTTIATFLKANLRNNYFGLSDSIDSILSCDANATIINSVGTQCCVEGPTEDNVKVWKVFSNMPLGKEALDKMFYDIEELKEIAWKAYPEYMSEKRHDKFKLNRGLYHVNAIEWAASAMEMSAIGGRNVAILAYNEFQETCKQRKEEIFDSIRIATTTAPHKDL